MGTENPKQQNHKNSKIFDKKTLESMAEAQSQDDSSLPSKRKLPQESNPSVKSPKLSPVNLSKNNVTYDASDDDDDHDYNLHEDDDEEEENPKVVDKKGKGILIEKQHNTTDDDDDDGSDDDDDDDDSDDLEEAGSSDSEEEDDPLAEVDLDNILPSRTRRKVSHQPGLSIKDNNGSHANDS